MENVSNFEIRAAQLSSPSEIQAVKVVCKGFVGIMFRNISHLTMKSLTFDSCGKDSVQYIQLTLSYKYQTAYGISVYSGQDTNITNCSFQDSTGTALGVFHSSLVLRGSNSFTNNCRRCSNKSCICFGGGIYAKTSILHFNGNNMFRDNSALLGGGIFAYYSTLAFNGDSSFRNNSVESNGGGILLRYSTLNFTGNCTFSHNSATQDGGGIKSWYSNVMTTGNTAFKNNTAKQYGGGIFAQSSTMTFTGNLCFTENSGTLSGAVYIWNSTLHFAGDTTLRKNSAKRFGGGIRAFYSTLTFMGNICFTESESSGASGGAVSVEDSTLHFAGDTTLRKNSAKRFGGGIRAIYSNLTFMGNICFTENLVGISGGAVSIVNSTLHFVGNITLSSNSAEYHGAGIHAIESAVNITGGITLKNNSATGKNSRGGGILALGSTLNLTGNITFTLNNSTIGGGVALWYSTLNLIGASNFRNNSAATGGGISAHSSTMKVAAKGSGNFTENFSRSCSSFTSVFMDNSAQLHGGGLYTKNSTLLFEGCISFIGNSALYFGGGMCSRNSTVMFSGNTSFTSNTGQLKGGGMYGLVTSLYLGGNSSFTANTAAKGGGQYLENSFNYLSRNATLTIDSNRATEYGGAVYVEDSDPVSFCLPGKNFFPIPTAVEECFIQIYGILYIPPVKNRRAYFNIHVNMHNNDALIAGNSVYGGSLDSCAIRIVYKSSTLLLGRLSFKLSVVNLDLEPNSVSSHPFQVCICDDGIPNCNTSELVRQVYPGELLHFPVVAAGQGNGIIPSVVAAFFSDKHGNTSLAEFQGTQSVKKTCTELYYQVHTSDTNHSDTLVLYADGPCSTSGKLLNISLQFLPCPPGFSLNSSERICGCEPRLKMYTTGCNITERTITREGEYWVGYDNSSQALILHPHCPFDYCKPATDHTSFPLNNTDLQCANNRSGFLCGQCKPGLSIVLGSSKCLKCSNLHVLLLIPFALAGIALVLLLLVFKLTVAAGTINGLIFYANVVTVNRAIFFPPNQTNILTVFIAWLNLDLGIETCFFDGMDTYGKTWLQFIFPLYIWSLVGLIIIASDYSSWIARLFGSNPVAVLATLFLLSYAKLLRTIIAALFFTFLDYPNEVQVAVWLYDGNIKYLHGKLIVLFLVASLTLLLLFLPYTLLLTMGQWLQAKSNRRVFYWINKPRIKPFLDAYQAPYRDQHRYWTGLMLCLRCALFLVFAFNTQADPSLNLLAIGAVVVGLLTLTHFTGLIYKKMYLDILEITFILNLGILAIATYYVKLAVVPVSQAAVAYTSVGVALTTFVGVLLYHTYQQVWPKLKQKLQQLHRREERETANDSSSEEEDNEARPLLAPTMSVIPSMTGTADDSPAQPPKAITFTELREPLDLIDTNDR